MACRWPQRVLLAEDSGLGRLGVFCRAAAAALLSLDSHSRGQAGVTSAKELVPECASAVNLAVLSLHHGFSENTLQSLVSLKNKSQN